MPTPATDARTKTESDYKVKDISLPILAKKKFPSPKKKCPA
jgi:hypothetical protein